MEPRISLERKGGKGYLSRTTSHQLTFEERPPMALRISNLSKTYSNGVKALQNLSLTIGNNMFGLLGPNGAGKSTLMRTIATLQEPDSGEIFLDDVNVLKEKDKVRGLLGYLPQ